MLTRLALLAPLLLMGCTEPQETEAITTMANAFRCKDRADLDVFFKENGQELLGKSLDSGACSFVPEGLTYVSKRLTVDTKPYLCLRPEAESTCQWSEVRL